MINNVFIMGAVIQHMRAITPKGMHIITVMKE